MSLKSFLAMPAVAAKVKPLRPKLPRKLSMPIKVSPRSSRYMLVGAAFDYLLRFEIGRRAPHAISERWVAELSLEIILRRGSAEFDLLSEADPEDYLPPDEVAKRVEHLLVQAKSAVKEYTKLNKPTFSEQTELAGHAIRLAKLESVYRALKLEPTFTEASPEDTQDLVELLGVVPFDALLHEKLLWLNPNFGQSSRLVGGADADVISGDLLVDMKTTKEGEIDARSLDQILGYLMLSRKQRLIDSSFPVINRVGLYFCRHGYLWSVDASTWTTHPDFAETEQWFFQHAEEVFGASDLSYSRVNDAKS